VLANLSDSTVSYTLDGTYYRYAFSGGGVVPSNGTKPSHTLTRTTAMSGTISIPSGSVLILWRQAASTSVTPARVLNLRVTN
jgi:hypothetical protein